MHVRVVVAVIVAFGINHRQRLLRCGRVIKINQRPAVYLCFQNREIRAPELRLEIVGMRYVLSASLIATP